MTTARWTEDSIPTLEWCDIPKPKSIRETFVDWVAMVQEIEDIEADEDSEDIDVRISGVEYLGDPDIKLNVTFDFTKYREAIEFQKLLKDELLKDDFEQID